MRAVLLCLALAACEQHIPDMTDEQVQQNYTAPITTPERNIETIGAQALCDSPAEVITEDQNGLSVTYCAPDPGPVDKQRLLAAEGD